MLTQTLLESLNEVRDCGRSGRIKNPYPWNFLRLLRLGWQAKR